MVRIDPNLDYGDERCLLAIMNFRKSAKPLLCPHLSTFSQHFHLTGKLRSKSDFYEIKQCKDLYAHELRAVKVYRKCEL